MWYYCNRMSPDRTINKLNKNSCIPLYLQLKDIFVQKISNGQFQPNHLIPGERQLSKLYNVSRSTAKEAIRELLRLGLVQRHPGKGTVALPNKVRVSSKGTLKQTFAMLIINRKMNPYLLKMYRSAQAEAERFGYQLALKNIRISSHKEEDIKGKISTSPIGINGLIVNGILKKSHLLTLKKTNIPFIVFGKLAEREDSFVTTIDRLIEDDGKGAYDAVRYLMELGHRKIAFVGGPPNQTFLDTLDGYRSALERGGLNCDKDLIFNCNFRSKNNGYKLAKRLLKSTKNVTAIYVDDYQLAMGIIKCVFDVGLKIPNDISMISGDSYEISMKTNRFLTTVVTDPKEAGRILVRNLVDKCENKKRLPTTYVLPTRLIVRKSCKPISVKESFKKSLL